MKYWCKFLDMEPLKH